jgi:redox-sensitive bicupin YhaK (pirin superfamily)
MMILRPSNERGQVDLGWLFSQHTFSFGEYRDANHMGFGPLRVINQDEVRGGGGFDTHGHRDMEILSYVIDGGLEHRDNIGNGSVIRPGEVQLMSAGTGIRHSEFNAHKDDPVRFLQIWIVPESAGQVPGYQQKPVYLADDLALIASRDGRAGSVSVHQDVNVFAARPSAERVLTYKVERTRKTWIQVIAGTLKANSQPLSAGDGLAITNVESMILSTGIDAHFLLFDLP